MLEIKDLHISFSTTSGELHAVRGIDLSIKEGETVGLVGESGCGKSVTAQAILQLLTSPPCKITSGEILFNGRDLLKLSPDEIRKVRGKEISMIFQDPMTSLNPTMKIGKQIMEVLTCHHLFSADEAKKRVIELLNHVGIENPDERFNQYPHEFSGGMRQRVMIALALACKPKLIIADEPTTALDVTIQAQVLDLMRDLKRTSNTSLLLITHDLGVVAGICDRVLVMYAGKIIESGTVDQIFYRPAHPYTKGLLEAIPRLGKSRGVRLHSIPGSPPVLYNPPQGCPFHPRCTHAMQVCVEHPPAEVLCEEEHRSACWLHHPHAPPTPFRDMAVCKLE